MPNTIKIKEILVQGNRGQIPTAKKYLQTDFTGSVKTPVVQMEDNPSPHRIAELVAFIKELALMAASVDQEAAGKPLGQITRVITDEFSFYPKNSPYTLDEYKDIINQTADIAKTLPPDVHMVLATFPVIWTDGGIRNCGLYVQSPCYSGERPLVHNFSKQYASPIDITYVRKDRSRYPYSTERETLLTEQSSSALVGSAVAHADPNQYKSAIKMSTSTGFPFITTIGVCIDHVAGVEREQVSGLIAQLESNSETIPIHCSHVITSDSITVEAEYVVSTISHADSDVHERHPRQEPYDVESALKYPQRSNHTKRMAYSPFASVSISAEEYPAKPIGTLHSDLFLQAAANQDPLHFKDKLNAQDNEGKTLLHHVFSESDNDRELIAKRLYAMIMHGADPRIMDKSNCSVVQLAKALDDEYDEYDEYKDDYLQSVITTALASKVQVEIANQKDAATGRTPLTQFLAKGPVADSMQFMQLLVDGGNPYQRDGCGESALDIVKAYPPFDRIFISWQLKTTFQLIQTYFMSRKNTRLVQGLDDTCDYNEVNFKKIMSDLSVTERNLFYEELRATLPTYIDNAPSARLIELMCSLDEDLFTVFDYQLLSVVLHRLDARERSEVFRLLKNELVTCMKSATDFFALTGDLLPKEQVYIIRNMDFSSISCEDIVKIARTLLPKDMLIIFSTLTSRQLLGIITLLLESDSSIIQLFSIQQLQVITECYVERIEQLQLLDSQDPGDIQILNDLEVKVYAFAQYFAFVSFQAENADYKTFIDALAANDTDTVGVLFYEVTEKLHDIIETNDNLFEYLANLPVAQRQTLNTALDLGLTKAQLSSTSELKSALVEAYERGPAARSTWIL